jgi:hypothetical protein
MLTDGWRDLMKAKESRFGLTTSDIEIIGHREPTREEVNEADTVFATLLIKKTPKT